MKSAVTISLVSEARGGPFVLWDDLKGSIEYAAELGYDAVEVFAPGVDAIDADQLHSWLDAANIRLAALGTGAGWVKKRLQLADVDAEKRKQARAFVADVIELAGSFGAMAIIGSMQGPSGQTGDDPEAAKSYLAEALEEGGTLANKYSVPLIYEPLNRYETRQCVTLDEGVELLGRLETKNVKLLADLFHMNIEETDIPESLRRAGDAVGHIHFVDSNRRPVGCGHMDFGPIIDALRQIDYQGYLCAEAFPYPDPKAAAVQTIHAYRYWTGATRS